MLIVWNWGCLYHAEDVYGMILIMFIIILCSEYLWFDTENSYGTILRMFMVSCSECLWFDTENVYGMIVWYWLCLLLYNAQNAYGFILRMFMVWYWGRSLWCHAEDVYVTILTMFMNIGYGKFLENSLLNNFDYTAVSGSLYNFCTSWWWLGW